MPSLHLERDAKMGALWNEIKNWRQSEHWSTRKFFQALVLGLVLTLLDTGTDLAFAESIPDRCPIGAPEYHLA